MKKNIKTICCTLMLCSLLAMITVGTVLAYDPSYTRTDWPTQTAAVIDGVWTSADEWTDGEETTSGDALSFRSTWDYEYITEFLIFTHFVVEFLTDSTNDTGDTWQMCLDSDADGGAAPQPNDFMIEVVGHGDVVVYEGDGSGWVQVTPDAGGVIFAEAISDSPTSGTQHWIVEITINKSGTTPNLGEYWAFMLAVFDESNSEAGVQTWPPTSDPDVPDGYGYQNYSSEPIPEGLSIGVTVLLSSISVLVGYNYLVKRKETKAQ